jgi:hypothetical protein
MTSKQGHDNTIVCQHQVTPLAEWTGQGVFNSLLFTAVQSLFAVLLAMQSYQQLRQHH